MRVKVRFPIDRQNRKAVREQLLLDSTGSGVEAALLAAADAAKTPTQKTFVSRSFGPSGRLAVLIVEPDEPTSRKDRTAKRTSLQEALGRVKL